METIDEGSAIENGKKDDTFIAKICPKCEVYIEKAGGCNKITCTLCKCKWCFYCGLIYPNSKVKKLRDKDMEQYCKDPGAHKHLHLQILP